MRTWLSDGRRTSTNCHPGRSHMSSVFRRTLWCRGCQVVRQKRQGTGRRGYRHRRVQRTPRWGRKCTRLSSPPGLKTARRYQERPGAKWWRCS